MSKKLTTTGDRKGRGDAALEETLEAFAGHLFWASWEHPLVNRNAVIDRMEERKEFLAAFKRNKASTWRYASDEVRVKYLHLALHNQGLWMHAYPKELLSALKTSPTYRVYALTLDLSAGVEAAAMTSTKGPADYLRRKITGMLRQGAATPFMFVVERAPRDGRLHLHGSIGLDAADEQEVRSVLKAVGGPYPRDFEGLALRMPVVAHERDAVRWAGYMGKALSKTRMLHGRSPVATTHRVIREARRLHALHRAMLLGQVDGLPDLPKGLSLSRR